MYEEKALKENKFSVDESKHGKCRNIRFGRELGWDIPPDLDSEKCPDLYHFLCQWNTHLGGKYVHVDIFGNQAIGSRSQKERYKKILQSPKRHENYNIVNEGTLIRGKSIYHSADDSTLLLKISQFNWFLLGLDYYSLHAKTRPI